MPDEIKSPTGEKGKYDYRTPKGRSNPYDMPEGGSSSGMEPLSELTQVEDIEGD